ncbi:MAG: GCN5-related N-acetyltransferase [Frankiales bacterium]|nr:GCN5-related N-acetyltransferase [Frankiales bacterium]
MLRPATADDSRSMYEANVAYDLREMDGVELDPEDVDAALAVAGNEVVVAEECGRVVGWASVGRSGEAETVAHPGAADADDLQRRLLAWVLDRARARRLPLLEHWAGARPDGAARLLSEAGFSHARTMWRMARRLDGALPEPVWPPAVQVRPFDPDRGAHAVWDLVQRGFAGTFGSHARPFEEWASYSLGPQSDAVCVLAGQQLLGVATRGPRTGEGHVNQLTVDPAQRGRGIALGLLHECFRRDAADGYAVTSLTVDGENAGARRLYEKAGMAVTKEYRRWERAL